MDEDLDSNFGDDDSLKWLWYEGDGDGKTTQKMKNEERMWGSESNINMRNIYDCSHPWKNLY